MKSAVLATLESYESEEDLRRNSIAAEDANASSILDDNSRNNPRKRARQSSGVEECLLGAMDFCTISTRALSIKAPAERHVARRTSKELACGIVPSPRTNGDGDLAMAD